MQKKIVIMDDDPAILAALSSIIEDVGYAVSLIDNDNTALSLDMQRHQPSLILLDAYLQNTNASKIITHIRKNSLQQRIPIILMSAYPNAEEFAQEANADDFLIKPFYIKTLLDKIQYYDEQQNYEKYGMFHHSIGSTKR